MKTLILSFTLLFTLISQPALSTNVSDFYCAEFNLFPAAYYEKQFKECKGETAELQGVCTQSVNCVFLSPEILAKIEKSFSNREFSKLTDEEKKSFFSNTPSLEWLPTTLTCPGVKSESGIPFCPVPEKCKGDLLFNVQEAQMNQEEYLKILQRYKAKNANGFSRQYQQTGN